MIDNPKPQKFSSNYATGGWVVAPIIKRFVNRVAPILKIYPISKNDFKQFINMEKYKIKVQNKKVEFKDLINKNLKPDNFF